MSKTDNGSGNKPDWMNPANDRKTPYTEEEIDAFVEDFILSLGDHDWLSMASQNGEKKTREIIRAAFVKNDMNTLANMTPKGSIN